MRNYELTKIIVAVSGGIDSVVMLDDLVGTHRYELIVAHVDHGIRPDSSEDAAFVKALAKSYGLEFAQTELHLGVSASEELARDARYAWLRQIKQQLGADAIATAHHQDDCIETMIINLLRGTGWRGLSALNEQGDIIRPLLDKSRADIIETAIERKLSWRDDATNEDVRYLRNFVRYRYVQKLTPEQRKKWIDIYTDQVSLTKKIDLHLVELLPSIRTKVGYSRYQLIMMERDVFSQVIQAIIDSRLERSTIDQLWHFVCTARPEKKFVQAGVYFRVTTSDLIVSTSDIC